MNQGWIKLHRRLLEWEWYSDVNTTRLFIHCLLRANHSDTKWKGQDIKRGQFLTSLETLSRETRLTVSQVRTSLHKLESTGEIASKSQARSRAITVLEYDTWQGNDKLDSKVIASSSQADDKLIATDKNVKKEKNENNEIKTPSSPSAPDCVKQIFDHWFQVMGKTNQTKLTKGRIGKIKARLAEGYTVDQIKQAIEGCAKSAYHMGQNDTGTVYDDLDLICRSGSKIEHFAENVAKVVPVQKVNGSQRGGRSEQDEAELARWAEERYGEKPQPNNLFDGQSGRVIDHE